MWSHSKLPRLYLVLPHHHSKIIPCSTSFLVRECTFKAFGITLAPRTLPFQASKTGPIMCTHTEDHHSELPTSSRWFPARHCLHPARRRPHRPSDDHVDKDDGRTSTSKSPKLEIYESHLTEAALRLLPSLWRLATASPSELEAKMQFLNKSK